MSRNPGRRNRLLCIVWIVCFLLEHCREVLLQNVEQLREEKRLQRNSDNTKSEHETFHHRHSRKFEKQTYDVKTHYKDLTHIDHSDYLNYSFDEGSKITQDAEISDVIAAVKKVCKGIQLGQEKRETLHKMACNKSEFKRLQHFWKRQNQVYYLYLTSSAVMAELGSCPEEMMSYVQDLVKNLGSKEAIELLEESAPIIEYIGNVTEDAELEDEDLYEPESMEYSHFKELFHVLTDSMDKVHAFSHLLDSKNETDVRKKITHGMEEEINDAIIGYNMISSIFYDQPDIKRRKRSAESYRDRSISIRSSVKCALNSFSTVSKSKMPELHKQPLTLITMQSQQSTMMTDSKVGGKGSSFISFDANSFRKRRSVQRFDNTVLIKNHNFPCKFLAVCENSLCLELYDEQNLINLLWVWENGILKHQATAKFLFFYEETSVFLLEDEMPRQNLNLNNHHLFLESSYNCTVTAKYNVDENTDLKIMCQNDRQLWSFVSFNNAKLNIPSLACLFLIQDTETCLVLTAETVKGLQKLSMKAIDNQNMINQVWQWNNQAIRHYNTRKYLSHSLEGSVTLTEISDEKWAFEDNQLKVINNAEKKILQTTTGKITLGSNVKNNFNLTMANEDEIMNCENNRQYFAIKHVSEPCKVLCPKTVSTGPGIPFTATAVTAGFVTGMFVGLLGLACGRHQKVVKIAFAVGVLLAITTAVVIEYTNLFKKEMYTVEFKDYVDSEPLTCLWYESSGTLQSFDNSLKFNAKSTQDGEHLVVQLSTKSEQNWLLRNGFISGISNDSCRLELNSDLTRAGDSRDELLFDCITNNVKNISWERVYHKDLNFRKQVICMYYLRQTNDQTCVFLTALSNSTEVRPRSHSDGSVLDQVWYTKGGMLVNVGTGFMMNNNMRSFEKVNYNEPDEVKDTITNCHENMFFIKSETVPCKLLTVVSTNSSVHLTLTEYSIKHYFNQLWTKVDEHLYNIGTGTKVYVGTGDSSSDIFVSDTSLIQNGVWYFKDQTIIFSKAGCVLSVDDFVEGIEVSCKNISQSKWSIVSFDKIFSFLNEILCTFFIQNQYPPCAFLTANKSDEIVHLEYMAADVLKDQIWFKSDDRIVNLQSGMSLVENPNNGEITLSSNGSLTELNWVFKDGKILEKNSRKMLNGFVSVKLLSEKYTIANGSQFWQIISSELILDHLEMFKCSSSPHLFFLKSNINSCELLTAGNNKEVLFTVFEESLIEKQLWYIENGRLFNVYTGNVLRFSQNDNGTFQIELSEMLIHDKKQTVYLLHDKILHVFNATHDCFLSYAAHNQKMPLSCQFSASRTSEWTRISYREDTSNFDELLCLFFLRSKDVPCEYLTGYGEAEVLKVRPLISELVNNQLFYWKGDHLVHLQTQLLITVFIDSSSDITLKAESIETERLMQRWSFLGGYVVPLPYYYLAMEVDKHSDGKIILSKSYHINQTTKTQQWVMIPYHNIIHDVDTRTVDGCANDENETNYTAFFIRSKEQPCLILSGIDQGSIPNFEVFNMDDSERFLWIYDNHHILNFKSGLALMVDFEAESNEQNVILWPKYAYSLAQKWTKSKIGKFYSGLDHNCFLHSGNFDEKIILKAECRNAHTSDLEILTYQNSSDILNNLSCTFFIKSNAEHCELLTGVGEREIRTRPFLLDLSLYQLWFWKGDSLVNYGNKNVMIFSNTTQKIMLQNKNGSRESVSWSYRNSYFISKQFPDSFMTISEFSGDIVASPMLKTPNELQQWILVDRDEGLNNPARLFCYNSQEDREIFVIKSEFDTCPLLVRKSDRSVGTEKMSETFSSNGLWIKDKHHIQNVNNGNCLAVKESVVHGTRVFFQPKYFYEKLQQWSTADEAIYSMHTNHSQYLTYTGSKVIMSNRLDNTVDKQKWKWYTVKEIEANDKLLRCSRCYNKAEETAAEVISFVPVFGWLYNIGRSIAYGAKNCKDVAISSLIEGTIDVAFDIVVGLSAGTASAFAYGVKTAMKLGIKGGLNAVKLALRSMVKHTFKAIKTNIIKFVRRGLKKTLSSQYTKMRIKSSASILKIKKSFMKLKSLTLSRLIHTKRLLKLRPDFKKKLKFSYLTSFRKSLKGTFDKIKLSKTSIPSFIKRHSHSFNENFKIKLKAFGNFLSERAEKAVKRENAVNILNNKYDISGTWLYNTQKRCKRVIGGKCLGNILKDIKDFHGELPTISDIDKHYLQRLDALQSTHNAQRVRDHGQMASACVIKSDEIIESAKEYIDDLRKAKAKPQYTEPVNEKELQLYGRRNVMHAEHSVLDQISDAITKNCQESKGSCKILLYSKLAPCRQRQPPQAVTCLQYITEKCKSWFESFKAKCVVAFKEPYTNEDIFTDEMKDSLAGIFGKKTNQNIFGSQTNDVKEFAQQNLDEIISLKSKLIKNLEFSDRQRDIFETALTEATSKAKADGVTVFWDTLFNKLDKDIKEFPFANWAARPEVQRLLSPDKQYHDIVRDEIEKEIEKIIRTALNKEAMKRKTVKEISDMHITGPDQWLTFHHI